MDTAYWQKNFESPVLFISAIAHIREHFDTVAFFDVRPGEASADPNRHILTEMSISVSGTSVMALIASCVNSYLKILGSLVWINITVDFAKLAINGACLADLLRYS
ncbi:hypothetical protein GGI42DRAFT_97116 [Trichoderma sp. SZMC 28013]